MTSLPGPRHIVGRRARERARAVVHLCRQRAGEAAAAVAFLAEGDHADRSRRTIERAAVLAGQAAFVAADAVGRVERATRRQRRLARAQLHNLIGNGAARARRALREMRDVCAGPVSAAAARLAVIGA